MRIPNSSGPLPEPANGVPTAAYALARLREATRPDAKRSLWEALQLALTYIDQEDSAEAAVQAAIWIDAIGILRSSREISRDVAVGLCFHTVATASGERAPVGNTEEETDWTTYASFLEGLGARELAKPFRGNAKRIAASVVRASVELDFSHEDAVNRRRNRPAGSHIRSVFPLHLPFFEALSRHPEGSVEARVATAGLFALRVLDHYMKVGDQIVEVDAIEIVNLHGRVAAVPDDHPMRAPLTLYVNRLQRAARDGVEEALHDLLAVGDAFLARGEERFAAEVYATVARYADPLDEDAATAMRRFRAIERGVRARGEELEGHPFM